MIKILDKITEYLQVRGEQLKLEIMVRLAKILSIVIVFLMLALMGFVFLIIAGIALSEYLNDVMSSQFWGYVIVSGFILLVIIIIGLLLKSGKIQSWLENVILKIGEEE